MSDSLTLCLQAIADPTRRAILDLLVDEGPRRAGDIAAAFPNITRPGISKHIRVLREAGLIQDAESEDRRERLYRVDAWPLIEAESWLNRYETFWRDRLDELAYRIKND